MIWTDSDSAQPFPPYCIVVFTAHPVEAMQRLLFISYQFSSQTSPLVTFSLQTLRFPTLALNQAIEHSMFLCLKHGTAWLLIQSVHLQPPTHLPGVIGFQLDGGQCGQASGKAHPFPLGQSNTVEYDAVRQNQSHEGPAHCDQDCQTTVHTKDQGSVLWGKEGPVSVWRNDCCTIHNSMQHTWRAVLVQ